MTELERLACEAEQLREYALATGYDPAEAMEFLRRGYTPEQVKTWLVARWSRRA